MCVLITNVDMVAKVNARRVGNARLYHGSRLAQCVGQRSFQIRKLETLVVNGIHVIVQVEEIAGHHVPTATPRFRFRV